MLTLLEPTFAQRGLNPEVVLPDPVLHILADPALVEQVLLNLLTNALDALQAQPIPQLHLLAHQPESHRVVLEVTDNGTDIPAQVREKIFVPFFTTKPAPVSA